MDTEVTVLRKKAVKSSALKTEQVFRYQISNETTYGDVMGVWILFDNVAMLQAVNTARRQGASIETKEKFGAAQNKHQAAGMNVAKLDRETEELKHDKVPLEVGKLIMQGRQAKGLSQKDLATVSW
jgi:hypothetical protein